MLIGQYLNSVGEKHQVSLPKKFREKLGDKLIITKGFENCLIVVSVENWKTDTDIVCIWQGEVHVTVCPNF